MFVVVRCLIKDSSINMLIILSSCDDMIMKYIRRIFLSNRRSQNTSSQCISKIWITCHPNLQLSQGASLLYHNVALFLYDTLIHCLTRQIQRGVSTSLPFQNSISETARSMYTLGSSQVNIMAQHKQHDIFLRVTSPLLETPF